jgi:GST-like protein
VTARPAVERGRAVAAQMRGNYKGDKAAQDRLFKRD